MKIQVRQQDEGTLVRWVTAVRIGAVNPWERATPATNCAACWTRESYPEWSEWDVPAEKVTHLGLLVTCQACGKRTTYGQLL